MSKKPNRGLHLLGAALLATSALVGCNRSTPTAAGAADAGANAMGSIAPPLSALPLAGGDTPVTPAPVGAALPYAPRARLARLSDPRDTYAYLDRAYAMSHAFGDAPPDYTVDYDGQRPWVWRGSDQSERVVEHLPDGLRYYYYEPGSDTPYLVQDPDYAYAYSAGRLVCVYGRSGDVLPYDEGARQADIAGRYLARSRELYAASLRQERLAVERSHWNAQRAEVAAGRAQWAQQQNRYAAWTAYHQDHDAEEQAHWADERFRREAYAARYDRSQNDPAAAAAAWQAARAAHDQGRDLGFGQQGFGQQRFGQGGPPPGRDRGPGPDNAGPYPYPNQYPQGPDPRGAYDPWVQRNQQNAQFQAARQQQVMAQQQAQAEAAHQQQMQAMMQQRAQQQAQAEAAHRQQMQAQAQQHDQQQRAQADAAHQQQMQAQRQAQAQAHNQGSHGPDPRGDRGDQGARGDHGPHDRPGA